MKKLTKIVIGALIAGALFGRFVIKPARENAMPKEDSYYRLMYQDYQAKKKLSCENCKGEFQYQYYPSRK